ncbi:MAG: hypothetical protein ABIS86_11745 [Streptosporangiaceae bacterium]
MTIPGWDVTEVDGLLTAARQVELTEYQRTHGGVGRIDAHDEGELWLLCDAQTRLAERLATAEQVAKRSARDLNGVGAHDGA